MRIHVRCLLAIVAFLVACSSVPVEDSKLSFESLTVNGRADPLGIATDDLSFAWATATQDPNARSITQSAYRIRVGTTQGGGDVWDCGQVKSNRQLDVQPIGSTSIA
jgi:hypothetical protein